MPRLRSTPRIALEVASRRESSDFFVGDEHIDVTIERSNGYGRGHLSLEGHRARDAVELRMRQEPIVKPASAAQAVAELVETQTGNDDQIDQRYRERNARHRLADAHRGDDQVLGKRADFHGQHSPLAPTDLRGEHPLTILPAAKDDGGGFDLGGQGEKHHDYLGLEILRLLKEPVTGAERPCAELVGRDAGQDLPKPLA